MLNLIVQMESVTVWRRPKKYMGYAHKKFTILGGPQGSKVNRALNREAVKGLGLSTIPLTTS